MNPRISVVVPIHNMKGGDKFLWRNIRSILAQTYDNYEIVVVEEGKIAENTNAGMRRATGDIIKILYLDDYLISRYALQNIANSFDSDTMWFASGCLHQGNGEKPHSPHTPEWTEDIYTGNNKIGSPSVVAFRNKGLMFFDENLNWLLDCDLYQRYFDKYGPPKLINECDVVIGLGDHQLTNELPNATKMWEYSYLKQKYAK